MRYTKCATASAVRLSVDNGVRNVGLVIVTALLGDPLPAVHMVATELAATKLGWSSHP